MIENLCSGTKRSATPYRNVLGGKVRLWTEQFALTENKV